MHGAGGCSLVWLLGHNSSCGSSSRQQYDNSSDVQDSGYQLGSGAASAVACMCADGLPEHAEGVSRSHARLARLLCNQSLTFLGRACNMMVMLLLHASWGPGVWVWRVWGCTNMLLVDCSVVLLASSVGT